MGITIECANLEEVQKKLRGMEQKAPKVLKLAVNDTARKAKQRLASEVQKNYAVKGVGLNDKMKIDFASASNPTATIHVKSSPISLYKFKRRGGTLGKGRYYNPTLHRYQTGKGGRAAMVQQLKGSSLKEAQLNDGGKQLKAFIATMSSSHAGVFQRRPGKKRGDRGEIRELMGSSIPVMVGNKKRVYGIVEPHIKSDLETAVNRHVQRALKGEI